MLPLNYAETNQEVVIQRVGGGPEIRQHLADLGFVPGGAVTVITSLGGNLIIKVKESRVALNEELARRIMVQMTDRRYLWNILERICAM